MAKSIVSIMSFSVSQGSPITKYAKTFKPFCLMSFTAFSACCFVILFPILSRIFCEPLSIPRLIRLQPDFFIAESNSSSIVSTLEFALQLISRFSADIFSQSSRILPLSAVNKSDQNTKFFIPYLDLHSFISEIMLSALLYLAFAPETFVARQKKQLFGQPASTLMIACFSPVSGRMYKSLSVKFLAGSGSSSRFSKNGAFSFSIISEFFLKVKPLICEKSLPSTISPNGISGSPFIITSVNSYFLRTGLLSVMKCAPVATVKIFLSIDFATEKA